MSDFAALRPDRDTVPLYDMAIAALEAVIQTIDRDDIEGRCRGVYAATEAVTSLYLNLDVKRFGELTNGLAVIYGHIMGYLVGINFYNDPRFAREAIELLYSLKEQCSAEIGMVSACSPAKRTTHVIDGTTPEHRK